MEDVLYFTRCKIQRVAAYNFFFFIHSAITQSKDFPLGSLTEGKKTIYHWKKRKMEDALYFTLLDVKSKELLYNFFHFFFFCIHSHNRKIFLFNQRKENYLSSKRKKRKMEDGLHFIRCKIQRAAAYNFFLSFFFAYIHTIERFSSEIFNRRKENDLSSKQKKNRRRSFRCKI